MKYLLVIGIALVVFWVWRNNRRIEAQRGDAPAPGARKPGPAAIAAPQDMVRCAVCDVHTPRADAVAGARGAFYCSQEHRLRAGG